MNSCDYGKDRTDEYSPKILEYTMILLGKYVLRRDLFLVLRLGGVSGALLREDVDRFALDQELRVPELLEELGVVLDGVDADVLLAQQVLPQLAELRSCEAHVLALLLGVNCHCCRCGHHQRSPGGCGVISFEKK